MQPPPNQTQPKNFHASSRASCVHPKEGAVASREEAGVGGGVGRARGAVPEHACKQRFDLEWNGWVREKKDFERMQKKTKGAEEAEGPPMIVR